VTIIPLRPRSTAVPASTTHFKQMCTWITTHRVSILVLIPLMAVVVASSLWNFQGYGAPSSDDEGTYWSQAWSLYAQGQLSHYTYWYDHPPFGWMQISAYGWLTRGFDRGDIGVMVAREVMAIANIASGLLLFVLMRRLRFNRIAATAAVLLFVLSPLAIQYHRLVYLDNLEVTWLLLAMVCAVSPKRTIGSAVGAALCLVAATLSKETALTLVPVVFMLIWQSRTKGERSWSLVMFTGIYSMTLMLYPLYAALKGELLAGSGHVSIESAVRWQLFERAGTGSVLDTHSVTFSQLEEWLRYDMWMPVTALLFVPVCLVLRRMRPFAVGYALQVVLLAREGYTPQPYIVALLPFAAILVAGGSAELFRILKSTDIRRAPAGVQRRLRTATVLACSAVLLTTLMSFGNKAVPQWTGKLTTVATADFTVEYRETLTWVLDNVPKDARIVSDNDFWYDLRQHGYTNVDWFFKVDLDPAVKAHYPNGWKDVDYFVSRRFAEHQLREQPTTWDALQHGKQIFTCGNDMLEYDVYKIGT
jgi:4-amino-4-deoxy-L-arabinose transferase-like glycosyltransferase